MLSATAFCHTLLRECVRPGDAVVDATAGNGHDTFFLTQLAGPDGKVFAFDIQPRALGTTARLLRTKGVPESSYHLIGANHAEMAAHLPPDLTGRCAAVIFNLGYLPGGDKSVITRRETTLPAVRTALALLRPGGLLLVVVYPGHPGGAEEAAALREWAAGLPSSSSRVTEYRNLNAAKPSPCVLAIGKTGSGVDQDQDADPIPLES